MAFRAMLVAAAVALIAAVIVNWRAVPWDWGSGRLRVSARAPRGNVPPPGVKTEVGQLPDSIPGFETITRQPIPGLEGHAIEALYVSLDMNLEVIAPIATYVRAETYQSDALARQRAAEVMKPFRVGASAVRVGKTMVGKAGYVADRGAYAITWTKDRHVFFVKSAFRDKIPVEKRDFLAGQARPVANGIDAYHRTGARGIKF